MIHHKRLVSSFGYAWEGLLYVLMHDQNLRIHALIGFIALIFGLFLGINSYELGLLMITIFFVFVAEMLNSAVEKVVDLITTEHRIEAKIAKDIAAGMVLVAAIGSITVGIFIFFPHIIALL